MTNIPTPVRFILNNEQNMWEWGKFGAPER